MSNLNPTLVDEIVKNCFTVYNKLPKTGKPIDKEWTVLSCVVKYVVNTEEIEVISLGTGSKCIGATNMSPGGEIMNDSHAEVFARRGFLIYLYENIERCLKSETSIFTNDSGKFKLRSNIEFVFYSSQLPCGDASIIPKGCEHENVGELISSTKHKTHDEVCNMEVKRTKVDYDIYRTGAKCLPQAVQDPRESGMNYHILGQVRTKPGRGDRTLSVSCSDKIAKWIHLGFHGSLLDMLCEPIYINHFIFGAGVPYSEEALQRAFLKRNTVSNSLLSTVPKFYQTSLKFLHIKTDTNIRPASGSIVWIKSISPYLEVAVQGKKLGVTKKKANLPSSSLCISKYNIYKRFLSVVESNEDIKQKLFGEENIGIVPYNKMKGKSSHYMEKWLDVKEKLFKVWTVKPDIWSFCVNTN